MNNGATAPDFSLVRYELLGKKLTSFTKGAREATIVFDDGSRVKITANMDDSGKPTLDYNIVVVKKVE